VGLGLDERVAAEVMCVPRLTAGHARYHVDPIPSAGGNGICRPEFERGDVLGCIPFRSARG
jgi:hypothetical protein